MLEIISTLPHEINLNANEKKYIFVSKLAVSEINLAENSELTLIAILEEGWEENAVINFNYLGQHSKCRFIGLVIGRENNKFSFETLSNHSVKNTEGYYYIRAALFDKSAVNYKGNLIMKKSAQLTNAYLSHHTLMLSKDAKNDTVPSLEIEADDVKAGHAATVGKVDEELVFYLESRGLKEEDAKKILIKAFMEKDLEQIEDQEIRESISQELAKKLA